MFLCCQRVFCRQCSVERWSSKELYDENNNIIHTFGGLKSNNYAAYGSAITTDANGNISIKLYDTDVDINPTNNQYHFANRPSIDFTANDDSKIYGNVADSAFSGISINSGNLINAEDFAGAFYARYGKFIYLKIRLGLQSSITICGPKCWII